MNEPDQAPAPPPEIESEPITTSEEVSQLFTALVAAQGEMDDVPMRGQNPHFRSRFVRLSDLLQAARPVLSNNNLGVISTPFSANGSIGAAIRLVHKSGEWLEMVVRIQNSKASDAKRGVQDIGGVLTYLRRYCLSGLLNSGSDEDDDGEGDRRSRGNRKAEPPKSRPSSPKAPPKAPAPTPPKPSPPPPPEAQTVPEAQTLPEDATIEREDSEDLQRRREAKPAFAALFRREKIKAAYRDLAFNYACGKLGWIADDGSNYNWGDVEDLALEIGTLGAIYNILNDPSSGEEIRAIIKIHEEPSSN
jgi:hypothetical protein